MKENQTEEKESIEDIVLRHSGRGMDILRGYKSDRYAEKAAQTILGWEHGSVLLTTGFFVAGFAETDGPVGTLFLAKALKKLGYDPVILTDDFCKGFFESEGIKVLYMPFDADLDWCMTQLGIYTPVGLISIERCGENAAREYANMRGVSITDKTAAADLFFRIALGIVPSIGVGDGGNEIGMGNMASIIEEDEIQNPILHHSEGVDLVPANETLKGVELALVNVMSRELILKEYVAGLRPRYDYILLDCAPSLGLITINALACADSVLIPVQAAKLALDGLQELIRTIRKIRRQINPDLTIEGVLITMVNPRTRYARETMEMLRNTYGDKIHIFRKYIPYTVRLEETPAEGVSIYRHDANGKAAEAYLELTKEVLGNEE